jgi:hypothetical protein
MEKDLATRNGKNKIGGKTMPVVDTVKTANRLFYDSVIRRERDKSN